MKPSEEAWCVMEWMKARSQREIADDIGCTAGAVCNAIKRFCDEWSGTDVADKHIYDEERKECAGSALVTYFFKTDGAVSRPEYKYDHRDQRIPALQFDMLFSAARYEHAWLLRAEGKSFPDIGSHLGVSGTRAHQMVRTFGRRVRSAIHRGKITARLSNYRQQL